METGNDLELVVNKPDPQISAPLTLAVRRATDAIREETRALRANPTADLKVFEYGKSRALLDLTRARTMVPPGLMSEQLKEDLAEFKGVLQENIDLLSLHMNAVSEVVEMLSRTMIDFDSDGTYQAPFPEPSR